MARGRDAPARLELLEGLSADDVDVDADHQDQEAEDPRQGVGEADGDVGPVAVGVGGVDQTRHEVGDQDPSDELEDARQEREEGTAEALEVVPADEQEAEGEVHAGVDDHVGRGIEADAVVVVVLAEEEVGVGPVDRATDADGRENDVDDDHQEQGLPQAGLEPLDVLGAEVLARVGEAGRPQRTQRAHQEVVELDGDAIGELAVEDLLSAQQGIADVELDHGLLEGDQSDRKDGELEGEGKAEPEMVVDEAEGHPEVGEPDAEEGIFHQGIDQAGDEGHELREDRREGRTGHTPFEAEDAEEVQTDVQHGGPDQEEEGREGVADAS